MEANCALQYKLCVMGTAVDGETNVFSDNNSIVLKSSLPESTLKKKHNSISYHAVRWSDADRDLRVCFEQGKFNMVEILTKNLEKTNHSILSSCILWYGEVLVMVDWLGGS